MNNKIKSLIILLILFLINCGIVIISNDQENKLFYLVFLTIFLIYEIVMRFTNTKKANPSALAIYFSFSIIWLLATSLFALLDPVLYPSPIRIARLMVDEFPKYLVNLAYSIKLMLISLAIGFLTAFPLGIIIGLNKEVSKAVSPFVKIISPISPIAYIPYVIGIMPSFRLASIFVIFSGIFWPILKWTIFGVETLDRKYFKNSELLKLGKVSFLTRVLIPGIMPSVLSGVSQSISGGFGILVAAEMIGSRKGLGFFIKYYADFLNYHKVIVGILYLGLSITLALWIFNIIQSYLLAWQVKEKK